MNRYGIKPYVPPPDPVTVEQLAAHDLVLVARQAATRAQTMTHDAREGYARRFEKLIEELRIAALIMRQGAPADPGFVPDIYRPDGPPLPERILLRAEKDALFHE